MAKTRRPLYKRERTPARTKGTIGKEAPISCIDASPFEVTAAIASLAWVAGMEVGRGLGYDSLKDLYTVIGKNRKTGKAEDFRVNGADVGTLIKMTRIVAGEKMNQETSKKFVTRSL